jgi:hypothetical protein
MSIFDIRVALWFEYEEQITAAISKAKFFHCELSVGPGYFSDGTWECRLVGPKLAYIAALIQEIVGCSAEEAEDIMSSCPESALDFVAV